MIETMSTVSEVLSALREFPSNSERGTAFEKLMVRYFQMHPILGQEYDQVCRWVDWEFRDNRSDAGIDLVARNREKQTWTAIQCKFYEPTHHLAKRDRYQVKRDKASGIVNDPNDWCDEVGNPRYIVDLIGKVTRVAVDTVHIVGGLRQK